MHQVRRLPQLGAHELVGDRLRAEESGAQANGSVVVTGDGSGGARVGTVPGGGRGVPDWAR
ncbi:hypothetical protein Lfu02_78600 [Longispora fulva]|nr:hypothetical protein Lfu02_78600 [Longispora fulva]